MGIYADYVDSYNDLLSAYEKSGNPDYAAYVNSQPDLLAAWEATGAPDYAAYVNSYPDLKAAASKSGWNIAKWGADHWLKNGSKEGRTLPKTYPQTKSDWGANHWVNHGQKENRNLPTVKTQTKDEWGKSHWDGAGKNETRILPGPKIQYKDGQLQLIASTIGAGSVQRYQDIVNRFNSAPGGDYLQRLSDSYNALDAPGKNEFTSAVRNAVDTFYLDKKVSPWDATTLMKYSPTGEFDVNYYAKIKPSAVSEYWDKVSLGDLDFIGRYGASSPDLYLRQDYTNVGRHQGLRGNPAQKAEGVTGFVEALTDDERSRYRDQVLGVVTDEATGKQSLVLATPQYDEEGKLKNPEEIDTLLEGEFAKVLSSTDAQKERQLGALAQDVLKESINALKEAKAKEANLGFINNLPGYSEILDINTTLANSILGDTGLGGILSITGKSKETKNELEKSIEQITGVSSNSTVYNWQRWFEDTLMKRYEDYEYETQEYTNEELKVQQKQAEEEIKDYEERVKAGETDAQKPVYLDVIETFKEQGQPLSISNIDDFKKIMFEVNLKSQKDFVSSFINGYLKPRFDQSKSMDEFISYLDVKEDEQNIFQSQTTVNKLKQIAELRSQNFLDLINQAEKTKQNFNAAFYFDPVSNNTREIGAEKLAQYQVQKDTVAKDFQEASDPENPNASFWATEAYRYGFEPDYRTNPETFAKLHYQVKGRFLQTDAEGKPFNFDPAEDILPVQELQKKIQEFGKELALRKELYGDASFMEFVTPEEYADSLLESIDPAQNKEEWKKILDQLGLDYTENLQQVKDYLIESFRTEEAKTIRENIKYLNEAKEKLTQKTLGVSYIEREEDAKKIDSGETALYNIFKSAGYGGTEDEFYTDFMPDVDRSEQDLIAKTMSDKGLSFAGFNGEDPFAALSNVSSFLGDDSQIFEDDEEKQESSEPSYFNIFGEDEEDVPQKSKAAQSFISDFTSLFAGFK
jgi:arsenate reductase-like glutaredoxin family protein